MNNSTYGRLDESLLWYPIPLLRVCQGDREPLVVVGTILDYILVLVL